MDDEPDLLEIGKLFLECEGAITVDTLASAKQALEQLNTERYDAIISDYQMPEMDGITFLKQLKGSGNTTPFIIFTGRGREEVVIEALNEGADFYLQKGGEPDSMFAELTHKIKTAVGRKRADDALKQDECRLQSLVSFYQMTSAPLKEFMTFAVEKAVEITASSMGYLAFVNDDETLLTMYAWSALSMKECSIDKKPLEYPVESTGLWGEAVRQRRPVITNDYAAKNPLKKGHPQGHVSILRHMNIPVFDGPHIVMVAGVGNKPSDYDERDVQELSLLMSGLWNVIKQRRAEEELLRKNEELKASYENITAAEEELRANLDELTRQELTLRESETRYRQFFRTTLDSVFITSPEGRWIDFNDALVEMFGYENREEMSGVPVLSRYVHPEERSAFLELIARDGYIKEHPTRFRKKDGTVFDSLITVVPQRNLDGSLKEFIGTVRVLTGKRRADTPHTDRELFNKSRAENLMDYIVVSGQDTTILYINPAAVRALGYDAETMAGTPLLSYVAEESREFMTANMTAFHELGEVPLYECELIAQGGLHRSVMVKSKPIQYDNNPATLLFLIDITQRKALEDQLNRRAAELFQISTAFQQANKKLTLLSTITRHDINNQLTVLIGYLGLLETELPDPTLTVYCQKAVTAADRILAMIRFTREYENIGITSPAWQDCRTLVDTAAKEAPLGHVMVKNAIPEGKEVFADPLIVKVFYNLMDNAVRYGGKITTIRFLVQEYGDVRVIICEDDGEGVPVKNKERIFERGFGENTGLGLALSREILDITGITLRETGEPGKGARFEMKVPKGMWHMSGMDG
ncbi:MAG: PAS domain S-box protein [Methanoregula sp.]|nr:PAS domain S-box protein [Methanoregula sp.]